MSSSYELQRLAKREETRVSAQVKCHESEDCQWEQSTELINVSPFGALFQIGRPTEPGRLLHLTLPLPRRIRCYDHDEEQYRIWSLVRHIKLLSSGLDEPPQFEVGAAFIGKDCPAIHITDPAERFDIVSPTSKTGLWGLRESRGADAPGPPEHRREPRHDIQADVVIELYDETGCLSDSEAARTENISRHGMAVLVSKDIVRGRYVRVRSAQYQLAVTAAVRRLAHLRDGRKRLHLEFVGEQWPEL